MNYPEGTIRTNKKGLRYIKRDGIWVYIKKPREEWDIPIAVPKEKVVYKVMNSIQMTANSNGFKKEDNRSNLSKKMKV